MKALGSQCKQFWIDEQSHLPFFIFLSFFFCITPIEIHKEWHYMDKLPDFLALFLVRLMLTCFLHSFLRFGAVLLIEDEEEEWE